MGDATTLPARFWSKVERRGPDDCWPWKRGMSHGYGKYWTGATVTYAHRVSYEAHHGRLATDLTVDHTCHNRDRTCPGGRACLHRRCVNPAHLEAVTNAVNRSRAPIAGWAAIHAAKTHCKFGHPLSGDNLTVTARQRVCRECSRRIKREYAARQRAKGRGA
jgi:hypothetical protein